MDIRRASDFILASIAMAAAGPVIVVAGVVVRFTAGSPAFYKEERYGFGGKPFTIYKLRTMSNAADAEGNLLPDDQRKTAFGKFLRSTAIDELPQLLNILKGDMTFIGPRPRPFEMPEHLQYRYTIKPGLTGLSQVNTKMKGRRPLGEAMEDDLYYIQNRSLFLDIQILFHTVGVVIARRVDVQEPGRGEDLVAKNNMEPTTGG